MADAAQQPTEYEIPTHPEEMKATAELRFGKSVSLRYSARITPAGIVTTGITICLVALAMSFIGQPRRRW